MYLRCKLQEKIASCDSAFSIWGHDVRIWVKFWARVSFKTLILCSCEPSKRTKVHIKMSMSYKMRKIKANKGTVSRGKFFLQFAEI